MASGRDVPVQIWDLTTGAAIGEPLTGHTNWVAAVVTAVLPDGRRIAVTGDGSRAQSVRLQ